jgi:hypothetical protein
MLGREEVGLFPGREMPAFMCLSYWRSLEYARSAQLAALDDFRNWVGLGLEAREKE